MRSLLYKGSNIIHTPRYKLLNGFEMPAFAVGTFLGFEKEKGVLKPRNKEVRNSLSMAIDIGYRHIATASIYNTEAEVGEAINMKIRQEVIKRENMFVTSQLWNTSHKKKEVREALKQTLNRSGLDYVDLYMMHWPIGLDKSYEFSNVDYMETWRGMEELQRSGLTKSIGVSNFNKKQLQRVLSECSVKPVALQIEIHPQLIQSELIDFCRSEGIVVMGFSPLGSLARRYGMQFPRPQVNQKTLLELSAKYKKTPAQIVLRWAVDRGVVPLPKSVNCIYLAENFDIFDFRLLPQEVEQINLLDTNTRFTLPSFWQNHPYYPFDKVDEPIPDPFKPS